MKLERLEEKLRDLETEEAETTASIEASQEKLRILENSTQTEVLRLKGMSFFRRGFASNFSLMSTCRRTRLVGRATPLAHQSCPA